MFLTKRWTYNIFIYPSDRSVTFGKVPSVPSVPLSIPQKKESKPCKVHRSTMTATEHQHQQLIQPEAQQMQLLNRMQAIPLIELALSKSASTYARIKDSHQLVGWALSTAESSLSEASRQAATYAKRFEAPISYFDQKLCQGLDIVEEKVPIVKQPPALIIEDVYMVAAGTMAPAVKSISDVSDYLRSQASTVKAIGWLKANEMVNSYYGSRAIDGINSTATAIDSLIDKYFPPVEPEDECSEVVPLEKDKLMRTLQTIGRLPVKAARRVYSRISKRLPFLNPTNFKLYMNNLMEFLRLAQNLTDRANSSSSSSTANGKHLATSTPNATRVSFEPGTKPASN